MRTLIRHVLDARAGDATAERAIADHLQSNPGDKSKLDELERLWDDIGQVPAPELRLAAVEPQPSLIKRLPVPVRWSIPLALAAGVAALVASTLLTDRIVPATAPALHYASADKARTFRLADGSTVTMAPRSTLDVAFSTGRRDLTLTTGEAYFQVTHDASRPFVVATAQGETTAVGTAFNVLLDGETTTVTVAEGKIRISGPGAAAPGFAIAGQQIRYAIAPGGSATTISAAYATRDRNALGWKSGMLAFDGAALGAVAAQVNRYAAHRIVITDPSLARLPIYATIRTDKPDGLLAIVAAQAKLDADGLARAIHVEDSGRVEDAG